MHAEDSRFNPWYLHTGQRASTLKMEHTTKGNRPNPSISNTKKNCCSIQFIIFGLLINCCCEFLFIIGIAFNCECVLIT